LKSEFPGGNIIDRPFVSTKYTPERYGGLLVCGLNYGGKNPSREIKREPWGENFTHISNRDRFVSRMATWFERWGYPLVETNGVPIKLNRAISQTNLFYDVSTSWKTRLGGLPSEDEIKFAFDRLTSLIASWNISGLLLAGVSMENQAKRHLSLSDWKCIPFMKSFFRRSSTEKLHVIVCPHPGFHASTPVVDSLRDEMRDWVEVILKEYVRKQPGPRLDPLSNL
jgi:hypothetical protein